MIKRTQLTTLGAVSVIGTAIIGVPGTARAFQCVGEFTRLPDRGAVGVPTNTILWNYVATYDHLVGPAGEPVEVDERKLRIFTEANPDGLSVLVPRAELQPNAEYTIVRDYDDPALTPERRTFRTGAGPSTAAPPLPAFVAAEPSAGETWLGALARGETLDFEGIVKGQQVLLGVAEPGGDDAAPLEALASMRELLLSPTDSGGTQLDWISDDGTLHVGIGDCSTWPAGDAERYDARFGAFDLAGNFSGWIDVPVEIPSREEAQAEVDRRNAERDREWNSHIQKPRSAIANCSTAASGTSNPGSPAWLALALGVIVGASRRRYRQITTSQVRV